jgi:hypothetical protein
MHKIFLSALTCTLMLGVHTVQAQQVQKTMKRLPDTGQTGDYTAVPGEDSDFRSAPIMIIVQGDMVIDTVTGLMWQRTDGGEMTWAQAKIYCDTLTLGGHTNWRLPYGHELFSIHDFSRSNPVLPVAFQRTGAEYWWSIDTLVSDGRRVWCTNAGGGIGPHPMTETMSAGGAKKFHVRAVRDQQGPTSISEQFTAYADETIQDNLTSRTWMEYCLPGVMTWEDALRAADTTTHGGFTDWRLPNVKELQSLSVRDMTLPTTDLRFFPCIAPAASYWTSTTVLNKSLTQAWIMQTDLGIATYAEKATAQHVILVRGGDKAVSVEDDNVFDTAPFIRPNPASDVVHLSQTSSDVRVYATTGEQVLHNRNTSVIDVQMLQAGVYSIVASDGSKTTISLFIKQ